MKKIENFNLTEKEYSILNIQKGGKLFQKIRKNFIRNIQKNLRKIQYD